MTDKILFVTKGGERCDEGFPYVLELAKTLNAGIEVLIMKTAHGTDFCDLMAAAAFAEAGDVKGMKEILEGEQHECRKKLEEKIVELRRSTNEMAVELACHLSEGDVETAVRGLLMKSPRIDMVLLSPSISENKKSLDIRKLIKNISKPIVHISKPMTAEI